MKNLFSLFIALFIGFVFSSCQKSQVWGHGSDMTVNISICLPDAEVTKSSDGAKVSVGAETDVVYYEIWNEDKTNRLFPHVSGTTASVPMENNTAGIDVTLVKNQTYHLVCWAQNKDCGAYDVSDLSNVKVDYEVMAQGGNDDKFDAFYAVEPIIMDGSPLGPVYLHRPFAQLNFGASKMETDLGSVVVDSTYVSVSNLSTIFDTFNGVGDADAVVSEVKFAAKGRVSATEGELAQTLTTGDVSYAWISMDYMLMTEASANVNVTAKFRVEGIGDVGHSIDNVTLSKNHRTNIVGDLFTSGASLEIIVEPGFTPDDIIKPI